MSLGARKLVACILCAALLGACASTPVRLDNIEYARFDPTRPTEVRSEACGTFILMFFIPARIKSRHARARMALEAQARGGVLTNVRVKERWVWMLVATMLCTEISATAYPRLPDVDGGSR